MYAVRESGEDVVSSLPLCRPSISEAPARTRLVEFCQFLPSLSLDHHHQPRPAVFQRIHLTRPCHLSLTSYTVSTRQRRCQRVGSRFECAHACSFVLVPSHARPARRVKSNPRRSSLLPAPLKSRSPCYSGSRSALLVYTGEWCSVSSGRACRLVSVA